MIVQTVAAPELTVAMPPGVPYGDVTVTDTCSACSSPQATVSADSEMEVLMAHVSFTTNACQWPEESL